MTDKQIIDVSKCPFFDEWKHCTLCKEFAKIQNRHLLIEADLRCEEQPIELCYYKQLSFKTAECEELKKQLMQKSEVDMFFNTPIEGWSNDPCGICPHKAENEELKKEIIDKNEKIKELRFSVSDLTNRFCSLNAEKSFRIVDLEQTLDEIKSICLKDVHTFADGTQLRYDSLDEILDIINKAKGEGNAV